VPGRFPGRREGMAKAAGECAVCLETWEPEPPGTLRICPGLLYLTL